MEAIQSNRFKMRMPCDEHYANLNLTTETQRAQRKIFIHKVANLSLSFGFRDRLFRRLRAERL